MNSPATLVPLWTRDQHEGGCSPLLVQTSPPFSPLMTRDCSPIIPLHFTHSLQTSGGVDHVGYFSSNTYSSLVVQSWVAKRLGGRCVWSQYCSWSVCKGRQDGISGCSCIRYTWRRGIDDREYLAVPYGLCKIWSFHGGDYEECRFLGYYAVWHL
jgi:hypothetical protein